MGHESCLVRVAPNGRLDVPAKQRKLLGLENGGMAVLSVQGDDLHIRPVRAVLSDLQDQVARALGGSGTTVDEFIAARREEAKTDSQS